MHVIHTTWHTLIFVTDIHGGMEWKYWTPMNDTAVFFVWVALIFFSIDAIHWSKAFDTVHLIISMHSGLQKHSKAAVIIWKTHDSLAATHSDKLILSSILWSCFYFLFCFASSFISISMAIHSEYPVQHVSELLDQWLPFHLHPSLHLNLNLLYAIVHESVHFA